MSKIVKFPKRRRKGRWTTARDYGAAETPRFGQSRKKGSGMLRRLLPLLVLVAAIAAWVIWQGARDPDTLPQPPGAPPPQEETALSRSSSAAELDAQQPVIGDGFAAASSADIHSANFTRCGSGERINCVVDGDTIWFGGEKIRFASMDTPEISSPGCAREAALGEAATRRMQELLNEGPFALTLNPGDENRDRYGRLLRRVSRDGQDLGEVLIAEGLSDRWPSSIDWCG